MERLFDTYVQKLKYKVLKEVASLEFDGNNEENIEKIPNTIMPHCAAVFIKSVLLSASV